MVDDGSTDDTPRLIASYGDRLRYHRKQNEGIAATRTVGGQLARGELIAYLDDDDLMPPDRITRLWEALAAHPDAALAVGDWEVIDADSRRTGQRSRFRVQTAGDAPVRVDDGPRAVLWPELTPLPHTTLFRRADGERLGWFDPRFFHSCEDTDFFVRCAALGPVVYVPHVVSLYRKLDAGLSGGGPLHGYSRVLLLTKHLEPLLAGSGDPELVARLRFRIRRMLDRLARERVLGGGLPERVDSRQLDRARAMLGWKERLIHDWLTRLVLPVLRARRPAA